MSIVKYYITYSRVSTKRQGEHGYSLGFQESEMEKYAAKHNGVISEKYSDIVSGTRKRKHSSAHLAIERCMQTGSTLLVFKLDRLCRDVDFLQHLFKTEIPFVFMDQPNTTRLNLNIMMSIAEYEAQQISERTKIGLRYAKLAGKKLGNPENLKYEHRMKANNASRVRSLNNPDSLKAYAYAKSLFNEGYSINLIADTLNKNHFTTCTGKYWSAGNVYNLLKKFNKYYSELPSKQAV